MKIEYVGITEHGLEWRARVLPKIKTECPECGSGDNLIERIQPPMEFLKEIHTPIDVSCFKCHARWEITIIEEKVNEKTNVGQ
jgi:hypothetical protein